VLPPPRQKLVEPPQSGERRVTIERPGTAAYLKIAWPAPALRDPAFFPLLVLDAILTGASGLNIWSMHRAAVPQRKARLYRALVDQRLASSVSGALLPTDEPFLYVVSAAAADGTPIEAVEETALAEVERVRREGVTADEVARARQQLHARFVLENDSVTNYAHQLGFFDVVAGDGFFESLDAHLAAVTRADVCDAARWLSPVRQTIGRFVPVGDGK
jgi:predicted Zn-dependent peptidase